MLTKEQQITAFIQAVARTNGFDKDQFDMMMHIAVITKHIADGALVWDEDSDALLRVPPREKMH